ncbi:MAG: thiamine pyrophosphate-binding protein [Chloroflexia bacterium]|nr:thiamine pyrophosphate-binding protein [Chloroflexia bacterium]
MTTMTGGQALVRSLKSHGIDTIFGLPGVQLDATFDALHEEQDSIRVVHTRHEQATAYMAFGYAISTGKVGTCLVVPGPGLLNATAALSTAYSANAPVLCLTGQIQSDLIEKGVGMLHEIPNQLQMVQSVTKWAARIGHPGEVPSIVREAFRQLHTGRVRPVELEMAPDMMALKAEVDLLDPETSYASPEIDPDRIEKAAKLLAGAKKPAIFVGGGIFGAEKELLQLAETLQAPVIMSAGGRGAVSDRHYLGQTMLGGHLLWPEVDVALAVGTRFSAPLTTWGTDDNLKIIRMDIDTAELNRIVEPEVGIIADSQKGLSELLQSVERHNRSRQSRQDELNAVKEKANDLLFELQPQASFTEVLREELPDDGVFVEELTQVGYFSRLGFPVYEPRTFVTSGYQGTLGYGFATALGAQVANPDKKVLSISGDGGFMYNMQELSTAVRHEIPLVAIVFRDDAFGNVKRMQKEGYDGRTIASDLTNPDFVKLAKSFGAAGLRANTPDELRGAIREGFANNHPTLIDVPVSEMPSVWHLLRAGKVR